jgi:type II secretory pathway predicted ATPase ExeA
MYENWFKLRERPFSMVPDASYFYLTRQHARALSLLEYAVASRAAFALLTGTVGSGKTLLLRRMIAQLDSDVIAAVVNCANRRDDRLMPWIFSAFGLDRRGMDDASMHFAFAHYVRQEGAAGKQVMLAVDEAQNLSVDMLEELRVLSNLNDDGQATLQIILVGQPELRSTMQRPDLRQFAQRISVDYHLDRLTEAEVRQYVAHRLWVAGGSPDLINEVAVAVAARAAGGIPRLVNQLCDMALVYAFADQVQQVNGNLMQLVVRDRRSGQLFPEEEQLPSQ